ncbi:hypothetical protein MPSEU_000185000 [Mayamaea pseudoterrestris]|nr:hypothetical protein MPSEU_000185000 [Mayamaea pseudoterrestris]
MVSIILKPAVLLFQASSLVIIYISQALLGIALFLSMAYYFGWIHRFIQYILESEASKILNHTPVTIGSVQFDILRGHAWINEVIIHSPRRETWQWESPVLARIGKAHVESNVLAILIRFWLMGFEEIPLDIYSVELADVQVFVERKQELFNFYLLDPHVQIPDYVAGAVGTSDAGSSSNNGGERQRKELLTQQQSDHFVDAQQHPPSNSADSVTSHDSSTGENQDKAQKLVDGMLRALGRAAKKGTFQDALYESRLSITTHLKALQKSSNKSEVMQEGIKIVRDVSKQFVEKERQLHQVVQPHRRKLAKEKIVYGRVGRIVVQDARIFTRDNIYHFQEGAGGMSKVVEDGNGVEDHSSLLTCWGKPIYLKQVVFRAAELCPPLSCKDAENPAFPAVYQPIDMILEVIQIRLLTELAKSPGRVFQTALGEMLDYWIEKSKPDATVSTSDVISK